MSPNWNTKDVKCFLKSFVGKLLMELKIIFHPFSILEDQGRFAIGYYHQRQEFFKKHETEEKGE